MPIGFASRTLTDTERKHDTYSREALAIVFTILKFKPYLIGKQFTVYTDHKPLLYFKNSTDPNSCVSRYQFKLQNFEYNIQYKPGTNNIVADCLSRNPVVEQVNVVTRTAGGLKRVNYKLTRTRVTRPKVQKTPKNIEASDDITDQSTEKEKGKHDAVIPLADAQSTAVEIADLQNDAEIESCKESNAEGDDVLADEIQDVEARGEDLQTAAEIELDSGEDENDCEPVNKTLTHGDFTTEKMIFECRDKLFMRKDNYVVFVSSDGQPCDEGARQFQEHNMLPKFADGKPGEVLVHKRGKNIKFGIIVRGEKEESTPTIMVNIESGIKTLEQLLTKLSSWRGLKFL
uniref:Reverse transcriptase RNase H-like domain-containing protein n=1 Tax=Trichogramma kaykai TaxID=54128 RepID=A0ABD2X715_9HYME